MNKKICFVTNYASFYHFAKWKLMSDELCIDFVFDSDVSKTKGIKQLDLTQINAKTINVKNYFFRGHMIWQTGLIKLALKKDYNNYMLGGGVTSLSSWIVLIIITLSRNKKLYWGDGHGWYGREGIFKTLIKKIAFHLSDGEFVYGNYAKQIMIRNGLDSNKIWVVHNSLNHKEQLKYRDNFSTIYKDYFKNNNPVIIFIGRLTKEKRLDMILSSINNAKANGFKCNCVIIGDGEVKNELIQQAIQLNIAENVWIFGPCYIEEKISELITNADLCVSPGNVGLTAMHSMAYGTPLITHNNFPYQGPEFESIVQGKTGDFFEQENIDNLSEKIISWFQNNPDREKIRQNCYKEIDNNWTPEFKVNIFKKIFLNSNNKATTNNITANSDTIW